MGSLELRAEVATLRARVEALSAEVATLRAERSPMVAEAPPDFAARVHRALVEVDARDRCGGLVPLPSLRRELAPLRLSREAFDRGLLALQRARELDLKIANDPRRVPDATDGIEVPGRGLFYYAIGRGRSSGKVQ